ncbi:NAD(P)H-binding protein [Tenggerimyces flavus]|uniref:NAD(P)H-binding protein n=1 Tax=Tenggerimyces flavus TaxID=1708749 RepID=A0ABV7YMJ1_9ACTN|nr:NAD(P)H-binding protein [Tenggerimyces flavus]MBM7785753.1 uncharacterized protein YbjT (DUF2867 family) [Tenggerimyces flavus]
MTNELPVLLVGGRGKTGHRVATRLKSLGRAVRIGSRTGEPPFDWDDQSTWGPALTGVSAAYVTYYPDIAIEGAADAIRRFVDVALEHGVRRLVLLSGRGEPEARKSEEILEASGADWTMVRCGWFAQNFSEGMFVDYVLAGEVALPAGEVGEPFVDVDDIADVVVAALTEPGHVGQLYELTGPRLLTFAEAVAEIAKAAGRQVEYREVSTEEFVAGLSAVGVPKEIVEFLAFLFGEVLDGRNEHVTDGVQRVLGRPPKDFADYARDAATTGVWNV